MVYVSCWGKIEWSVFTTGYIGFEYGYRSGWVDLTNKYYNTSASLTAVPQVAIIYHSEITACELHISPRWVVRYPPAGGCLTVATATDSAAHVASQLVS